MRNFLLRVHWLLSVQFGLNFPRFIQSIRGMPRYFRDLRAFKQGCGGEIEHVPCLFDWNEQAGEVVDEYFWQDLLVARMIASASPRRHVDVGSRLDGFVAHLASFREVEVFDIRPIQTSIPGVVFQQADLMEHDPGREGVADSVSCLHALEHFGLGRYGDGLDPEGHRKGFEGLTRILEPGGTLYLAVPVGQPRVEFNANRVIDPSEIVGLGEQFGLSCREIHYFQHETGFKELAVGEMELSMMRKNRYGLGVFVFEKNQPAVPAQEL